MSHVEAINAVLEQFNSYLSNCLGWDEEIPCPWGYAEHHTMLSDICENNNLVCRKKLVEAAEELDA